MIQVGTVYSDVSLAVSGSDAMKEIRVGIWNLGTQNINSKPLKI